MEQRTQRRAALETHRIRGENKLASTYKDPLVEQRTAPTKANPSYSSIGEIALDRVNESYNEAKEANKSYNERLTDLSTQTYTPSDNVTAAQNYLQGIIDNKPGSYESKYTDQLQGLYDRIMNREAFSYDLNGDLLYKQYADQYQRMGQQAMMDTMGQAAAMTGGYGNSYAQTAGQQTYQGYLQKLNEIVPELQQQAYNRYAQEGEDLRNQYAMAQSADQQDYARHQDAYNQWSNERSFAQSAYDTAYSQDYTDYTNRLNMAQQMLEMERQDAQIAEQYQREDAQRAQSIAYDTAMAMIKKGSLPSSELLATAGISDADALALAKKYGYKPKKSSSGSSSSKKSSGGDSTVSTSGSYMSSASQSSMAAQGAASKYSTPNPNYDEILKELLSKK